MIGEIGSKWLELLPEIVPVLISLLDDGTPAVARQSITCAIDLFHCILEKVAIQVSSLSGFWSDSNFCILAFYGVAGSNMVKAVSFESCKNNEMDGFNYDKMVFNFPFDC